MSILVYETHNLLCWNKYLERYSEVQNHNNGTKTKKQVRVSYANSQIFVIKLNTQFANEY